MKIMKWIIPVLIATLLGACSKVKNIKPDFSDLKKEVFGSWIEVGDCEGCRQVEFSSNELTVHYLEGDIRETMPFSFISKDSIQVKRNIDGKLMTTLHGVVFHEDGTTELKNFVRGEEQVVYRLPTDVVNFHPLVLRRIE